MSDAENDRPTLQSIESLAPALKELAERSKIDPELREKFNREAPDYVLLLVAEIEFWQESVGPLRELIETYEQASQMWDAMNRQMEELFELVHEEIRRGKDAEQLYEKYLRPLIARREEDDDGPVN
jgi:uncharacterized protein YeaO (DUF488 family)